MKMLYLHQYFKTNQSSGGTRSYEFAKFLGDQGIDVHVITGIPSEPLDHENIKVTSTGTAYNNKMSKSRRILSFLDYNRKAFFKGWKDKEASIIFATSTPLTIGLPAVLLAKMRKKKLIFEVRDVWPDVPIALGYINNKLLIKFLRIFEKWIYNNAAHIIVLSDGMHQNLINKGVPKEKLTTIENMANLYLYDEAREKKESPSPKDHENPEIEGKYQSGEEKIFTCIHPGTMGHVNGLDFVLDAAKITLSKDPEIHYLLIGDGKQKDHLKNRVQKEKIVNVTIEDAKPKAEVVENILSADVGLMCVDNQYKILEDNSANKFFDFLAAGLPVLINYGGWQKRAIEENHCGKATLTPEDMAEEILSLKKDSKRLQTMAKNARALAEEKYSDNIAKEKLLQIINGINEI